MIFQLEIILLLNGIHADTEHDKTEEKSDVLAMAFADKEREVEKLNQMTYDKLNEISKTNYYSKVKMMFYEKCPKITEGCKATACEVPTIKYGDEDGVVDLLSVVESYSPSIKHSNLVWADIYKAMENEAMIKVVSGLHFSVTTHIAAFHTPFFGFFLSNPKKFKNRYAKEFKENFLNLWLFVRAAVANLKNINTEANEDALTLSRMIDVPEMPKIDISANKQITRAIECIACLNCQKCILWGTIQTRGLKAAVKAVNSKKLYKSDVIFLINVFRRLSETMRQSRKMYDVRYPSMYLILVYYKQMLPLIAVLLFIAYRLAVYKKNKKVKYE
ncbi:hypothetical protein ECANGB1_2678 [Enterospora canceri]|uniref:ERO1A n=1 Tax=Enterospora canceri TaxID=1081671 RepID=A0A1Y1S9M6_9MICR|nr:hypothetical protein ECANGB1_2678 [Enterospora canceri]